MTRTRRIPRRGDTKWRSSAEFESSANAQFTISSAPEDPFISVHIRQVGDFTHALGERLGAVPTAGRALEKGGGGGGGDGKFEPSQPGGEGSEGGEAFGRRGRFIEVAPQLGKGLPVIRVDG
jgi:NADPH oxidase